MVVAIKLNKTHTLMASGMMWNRTEFQDNPFSLVSFCEKIHLLLHREEENIHLTLKLGGLISLKFLC